MPNMKYISRIDSGSTHCYWVRIGFKIACRVQRSFSDLRYGGQRSALKTAKDWRNHQLKKLLLLMNKEYGYDVNGQKHWGKGVNETWDLRSEPPRLSITATYWDNKKKKQLHKAFSVNKYGYDKALLLATQWRKFKLTGEL